MPSSRLFLPSSRSSLSDLFVLEIAEKLEDSLSVSSPQSLLLQKLRNSSSQSLLSQTWPSSKDEHMRFTDTSFLKNSNILAAPFPAAPPSYVDGFSSLNLLIIVDGHVISSLSYLSALPSGAYTGGISNIPQGPLYEKVISILASRARFRDGDLFWHLNGIDAANMGGGDPPSLELHRLWLSTMDTAENAALAYDWETFKLREENPPQFP